MKARPWARSWTKNRSNKVASLLPPFFFNLPSCLFNYVEFVRCYTARDTGSQPNVKSFSLPSFLFFFFLFLLSLIQQMIRFYSVIPFVELSLKSVFDCFRIHGVWIKIKFRIIHHRSGVYILGIIFLKRKLFLIYDINFVLYYIYIIYILILYHIIFLIYYIVWYLLFPFRELFFSCFGILLTWIRKFWNEPSR